jgi:hypothetical protein
VFTLSYSILWNEKNPFPLRGMLRCPEKPGVSLPSLPATLLSWQAAQGIEPKRTARLSGPRNQVELSFARLCYLALLADPTGVASSISFP